MIIELLTSRRTNIQRRLTYMETAYTARTCPGAWVRRGRLFPWLEIPYWEMQILDRRRRRLQNNA